jgi:hypothetical protein
MPLFFLHAALMGAGFLLAVFALLIAMTQRRKRWWLRLHRIAGLTGTSAMLLGVAAAVAAVAAAPEAHHFRSPHTWIGALTIAFALGASALGLLQFRFRAKAVTLRTLHRLSGRLANLLTPIAILLGLRAAELI